MHVGTVPDILPLTATECENEVNFQDARNLAYAIDDNTGYESFITTRNSQDFAVIGLRQSAWENEDARDFRYIEEITGETIQCDGCFETIPQDMTICELCGYDNDAQEYGG